MKIIYLINSMDLGGAERLLIDTVNHLLVMSLDVEVIVIKDGYLPYEKEMKDLLGTRCHFLHCTDYSILTMVKVIKKLYEVKSKNKGNHLTYTSFSFLFLWVCF